MAYNTTQMRWMQQDPAGYVDSASLYLSELGNPVTMLDPFGLDSIEGTPNKKWAGEFTSPSGVKITVNVYDSPATLVHHLSNGTSEKATNPLTISLTSADPNKENCEKCHVIQFVMREEVRKPGDPPRTGLYESGPKDLQRYFEWGKWHLDSPEGPYYDTKGMSIRNPGLLAVGDLPGRRVDADEQRFNAKSFILCGDKVQWLVEWNIHWSKEGKQSVQVTSSKAAGDFGQFNTERWNHGYKDTRDFVKGIDLVEVNNPIYRKSSQ